MIYVNFEKYKKDIIKIAKDLVYGKEAICRLKNARTINELTRIMKDTREKEQDEHDPSSTNHKKRRHVSQQK